MKKIFITFMAAVSLLTFNRCTSLDMEPGQQYFRC